MVLSHSGAEERMSTCEYTQQKSESVSGWVEKGLARDVAMEAPGD